MDALPPEVNLRILSYTSGEDLQHFKRLNSRFRDLIVKNKKHLKFPTLMSIFYDTTGDPRHVFHIQLFSKEPNVGSMNTITCDPYSEEMFIVENEQQRLNFFDSFFEGKLSQFTLHEMLIFLFAKVQLRMIMDVVNLHCISSLIEVVRRHPSRILSFRMSCHSATFTKISPLAKAVANHTRRAWNCPRLTIRCDSLFAPSNRSKAEDLNELCSLFSTPVWTYNSAQFADRFIVKIVKEWKEAGCPQTHYMLQMADDQRRAEEQRQQQEREARERQDREREQRAEQERQRQEREARARQQMEERRREMEEENREQIERELHDRRHRERG